MEEKIKMHTLRLRTDGKAVETFKQIYLAIALGLAALSSLILFAGNLNVPPKVAQIMYIMFFTGIGMLVIFVLMTLLLSKHSPVKWLAVRKQLILFTRLFIKPETNGLFYHSVKWLYGVKGNKIIITLYPNGLVRDTEAIGKKLSEFIGIPLLKHEESDQKVRYLFGDSPERYNGILLMQEGLSRAGKNIPMRSYVPIPIYDATEWDFTSEALHMLLVAPSGSGKTMFLNYLGGMILKRQHRLYIIDAKNSQFGRLFKDAGVRVATNIEQIIELLTSLVEEMEKRYSKYFATGTTGIDANFSTLNLEGHFLIFDEILSVLNSADKKEKSEMERLLGQLALKGRAAGISIVISAQKINASDLPKSITEQCQTRIILGKSVSDETFHQVTGLYKKDAITIYKGGVGKGYAITPKTVGLVYIETPVVSGNLSECINRLKELRDGGIPNAE